MTWYQPLVTVLLVALGVMLVSGLLRRHFSTSSRAQRRLRTVPTRRIADVRDGELVKLTGVVRRTAPPSNAPLTGRPCTAWTATVDELQAHRTGMVHRQPLLDETHADDFLIDDGAGAALVRGAHVQLVLQKDEHVRSGTSDEDTAAFERCFARFGLEASGLRDRELLYREGALAEGARVVVLGRAREASTDEAPGHGRQDHPREAPIVLDAPPEGWLVVSDDPGDT